MAFNLQAIVGSTTISLYDGNPFSLLGARGFGGASIRRVVVQGPAQQGDTDTGYRLNPRELELVIGFQAASDAALDAHRDTLTSLFKPLTSTPIYLRVTRDDGGIRQLDCHVVGDIKLDLLPEHRPGHYHRATVRLRAADPALYGPTPGTAGFVGSVVYATNWWLAGGAIAGSQVVDRGGTVAANASWAYTGTIPFDQSWTLALRAGYVTAAGTEAYMFKTNIPSPVNQPTFGVKGTATYGIPLYAFRVEGLLGTQAMTAGTQTYFMNSDLAGVTVGGTPQPTWRTTWIAPGGYVAPATNSSFIIGTAMTWRTLGWSGSIPLYALYSPALSEGQRNALSVYMQGFAGSASTTVSIPYQGDLPEHPVISVTGPVTGPTVVNTATGERLSFGTHVIGAGTTYVIDTRYGQQTVVAGTVNKRNELAAGSDLGTWHLAPAPIAAGGTNVVTIEGTGMGSATSISIIYYNRFESF